MVATGCADIWSKPQRPDLYPPILTLELSNQEKLSPGYIFVSPYEADNPGPYIYDNQGVSRSCSHVTVCGLPLTSFIAQNLVWSGWGSSGPGNVHGIHVCKYKGADHLCFFQGNQQKGYCRGHGIIMDNRYRIVKSVQAGGGMSSSDMHEFRPINDGKTALLTIYQQRQYDMSPWNIKTGMGWIMESIFQEVEVETSKVLFEWRSLDHVHPTVSYTLPASTDTSGDGLSPHTPWDYFHINSIDKNADGDYLISSRHTCCIYKISGKDGHVIWRLHGANPSFRNINFSFSQQHDARWISENETHTVLSLYNNGYNGFNKTHDYSSGMIIVIDHVEKTATQIKEYAPPGKFMSSSSQGNLQILPNKNVFMGWGNNAFVSEHDENGELLLWGYLAKEITMNYRAQKFEWDADPTDVPALWTYSKATEGESQTSFYVSWNGATRVKKWRFYGAREQEGPFRELAVVDKDGFETLYTDPDYHPWAYVEALDASGKVLARSTTKYTFVPSPELSSWCGDTSCDNAPAYGYPGEEAPGPTIPPPVTYPPPEEAPAPVEPPPQQEPPSSGEAPPPVAPPQGDAPPTENVPPESPNNGDSGQAVPPENPAQPDQADSGWVPVEEEPDKEEPSAPSSDSNENNAEQEGQESTDLLTFLDQHWILTTLGVVGGLFVAVLLFRWCHPQRRYGRVTHNEPSDSPDDEAHERKPPAGTSTVPWWQWRRWAVRERQSQRYFPLSDRNPEASGDA